MKQQTILEFMEQDMNEEIQRLVEEDPTPAKTIQSLDDGLAVNLLGTPSDDIIRIFASFTVSDGPRIAVALLSAYGLGQRDYGKVLMDFGGGD